MGQVDQRHDHFVYAETSVGDADFTLEGKGFVSIWDKCPQIIGKESVWLPKCSVREICLHLESKVQITVGAGSLATSFHRQPFEGSAYAHCFGMPVIAGQKNRIAF